MIPSGIPPLDRQLGGLVPGRIQLVAGGVGTGKTTAGLQFLAAGVRADEVVALLTRDTPEELAAHARFLAFDLRAALVERRLTVLRYGRRFAGRVAGEAPAAAIMEELRREWAGPRRPSRIVVDPVSPFLGDGRPGGAGLLALLETLEDIGATTLLTWPGPVAGGEDRRLDPLLERAALVATITRERQGGFAMRIDRARLTGAPRRRIPFDILPHAGIVDLPSAPDEEPAADRLARAQAAGS